MSAVIDTKNNHFELSEIILKRENDILTKINHPLIYGSKNNSLSFDKELRELDYIPLSELILEYQFNELEICDITKQICDVLKYLWNKKLIFNNICPESIYFNIKERQVKLVNFKQSSDTRLDYTTTNHLSKISGNLHFISPEQTGRIGRSIDYRSDIYSLGALVYFLLTKKFLYNEKEPHKIIHAHITKTHQKISSINRHLHPVFELIVDKMLEKNAEDRYQTATGITEDIQQLEDIIRFNQRVENFELARGDLLSKFEIPTKIYGRTEEKNKILNMVHLTANSKSRVLLVNGYSGIGKTALVNEVKKPITEYDGLFINGKFDQFKKNIPYFGISQAFIKLVDYVLIENHSNIQRWRDTIIDTVGDSLHLLTEIIPNLERLVGEQEKTYTNLDTSALQNLLHKTFKDFISCFKKSGNPLVIFLDDLQWADQSTINLIKYLFSDIKDQNLLLICGYRNNEVDSNHPFQISINHIKELGTKVEEIALTNLNKLEIVSLIEDTLKRQDKEIKSLADIIYKKTQGNPFFTINLLENLHRKSLIKFDNFTKKWYSDLKGISSEQVGDNLIDLLMEKLDDLSSVELSTIQSASVLGTSFKLSDLKFITNLNQKDLIAACKTLIEKELIIPLDDNYKFIEHDLDQELDSHFKFIHDKIQQASNESIGAQKIKSIHENIASHYIYQLNHDFDIDIFDLVFHLNNSSKESFTHETIIKYNEIAGQKAYESSSYQAAMNFYEICYSSLLDNKWEDDYDRTLRIATQLSENYYLCAQTKKAEELYQILLDKTKSKEDKAKVFEIQMNYYTNQGKADDAIAIGSEALKLYGIDFPKKTSFIQVLPKLLKIKTKLFFMSSDDILNLPNLTNEDALASMKILSNMSPSCFIQSPESMLLNCLNCLDLTLKHGITDVSSYAVSLMAFVETIALNNHKRAYELVELAYDLNEKVQGKMYRSKLIFAYNNFIQLYHAPIEDSINELKIGHIAGINCGDFNFANYCLYSTFSREIYLGRNLLKVYQNAVDYSRFSDSINDQYIIPMMQVMRRYLSEMTGHYDPLYIEVDKNFDLEEFKKLYVSESDKQNQSWLYIFESMLQYFKGNYLKAYEYTLKAEKVCEEGTQKQIPLYDHYFFSILICAEVFKLDSSFHDQAKKIAYKNLKNLKKVQTQMPKNFRSRYLLAKAVIKMNFSPNLKKEISFDFLSVIGVANEDNYLHIEGIACEIYGRFLKDKGIHLDGAHYLKRALGLYERWGANFKVQAIANEISNIQNDDFNKEININSFIEISESLSNERDLEVIFKNILETAITFSNSLKGAIFRRDHNQYFVISNVNNDISHYPQSIIDYAYNSNQIVRIDSIFDLEDFSKDKYFTNNQVRSLLALPLVANGEVESVLYLENSKVDKVFTADKTRILEIISTQMALSIKNAYLFKNLEKLVSERTEELEKKTHQLQISSGEKQTLIRVLCHDLANLLMSSRISFKRLNKKLKELELSDPDITRYLKKIDSSFTNQSHVIDNVRHLELAKEKGFQITLTTVDFLKTLTNSIDTFEQQISTKKINIVINENLNDIEVLSDELCLGVNILNNLISNAIKFTFEGGKVSFGLQDDDQEYYYIYIKDSGIGMKDQMVRNMFQDNIHTSTRGTNSEPGSGFGLSIIKSYVNKMNGDISVTSKHKDDFPEESGTTFILKLKKAV